MMKLPATIDFETFKIQSRPQYPPVPVGVSILLPGKKPHYYAWGHVAGGNNCKREDAERALRAVYKSNVEILCHNGKFDLDVAEEHFGLPLPPWERCHDTMFMLALHDPFMESYGLKEAAALLLDMPPEERDTVAEWILAHVFTSQKSGEGEVLIAHSGKPANMFKVPPSKTGAFIAYAPGDIAAPYANGDVVRTLGFFKYLWPEIKAEQLAAYNRERRLMPILLRNEREGIIVDTKRLKSDIPKYSESIKVADQWLRKRLKSPKLNVDSDEELADALDKCGVITEWTYTEKSGQRSTSKKNMTADKFTDAKVFQVLGYRNRMSTTLGTFMEPWAALARGDGRIHCTWNQLRQSKSNGDTSGTRTGRPSTRDPNFLNVPKAMEGRSDGFVHPSFIKELPLLPLVRIYLMPDPGGVWIHRDYNQQELRILAHFEDGALLREYLANPRMDVHTFVQNLIKELVGLHFDRKFVKETNFGKIYGMGLDALMRKIGTTDVDLIRKLNDAHGAALPDVKILEKQLKRLPADERIITWGGRMIPLEPPMVINGRRRSFEYKRLNYLIQGSAADCTKEAIIRYDAARKHGRFLVSVYDENNISAPKQHWKEENEILRECMEGIEFDVPMLTDGKAGKSWGEIE